MAHSFRFSILGVHIKNAEREVNNMHYIKYVDIYELTYEEEARKLYEDNLQHGILAIYSMNSALETLVYMIDKEFNNTRNNFYDKIKNLQNNNIITNEIYLNKCIDLRKKRNIITHWEEDSDKSLGCFGHIVFGLGQCNPKDKIEELISILNRESLEKYLSELNNLIENILDSDFLKNRGELYNMICSFKDGEFEVNTG